MDNYIHLISNVGFPIFVALYLLVRLERVIKSNTDAIIKLKEMIMKLK